MKILYKYVSLLYTDSYYKYEHPVNILGHLDRGENNFISHLALANSCLEKVNIY